MEGEGESYSPNTTIVVSVAKPYSGSSSSYTNSAVSSEYKHSSSTSASTEKDSVECSPTERVEKLLKKYKFRTSGSQSSSSGLQSRTSGSHSTSSSHSVSFQIPATSASTPLPSPSRLTVVELELWESINDELRARGFQPMEFVKDPSRTADHLLVSVSSSSLARITVSNLLRELKSKDNIIKCKDDLISDLKLKLIQVQESPAVKFATSSLSSESDHVSAIELKSEVARLEYDLARLRIELQNRPSLPELTVCQKRVKELEFELVQCKSLLSSEQLDLLQSQEQIKYICSLLSVPRGEHIIPKIRDMKDTLKQYSHLEKHFSSLVELLYHPSAPKLAGSWERCTLPRPKGHDLWCEVTWNHIIMTLNNWSLYLQDMQELEHVIREVCHHLDLQPSHSVPNPPRHLVSKGGTEEEEENLERTMKFNCHEMAVLLRRWLMKKPNMKSGSFQMLLAMVRHFQHLFRIPRLEGVYPTMTVLNQQIEHYKNVLTRLKEMFHLDASCSSHKLVSAIEYMALKENSQFLSKIYRHFGAMDVDSVIEELDLSHKFFPSFQSLVQEIQRLLGVSSPSEIVPAIIKLKMT